ncbi:MAG: hypothetical protein GXY48_10755 [Methanomicrobiales archaeon]|nr:hypothetical protein [Methanomicrobiales archaeon]
MNPSFFIFGSCLSCTNRITGDMIVSFPGSEPIRTGEACRKYILPEKCERDKDTAMCSGWIPCRGAE